MKKTDQTIMTRIRMTSLLLLLTLTCTLKAQYFIKIANVITSDSSDSRSVNWVDYDNDNDLDIFISNGHNPPMNAFLYENSGHGEFIKHPEAEVALNNTSADGSSWADYNNDGYIDLFIVAWYGQRSYLYTNYGNGDFEQVSDGTLGNASGYSESCSWGDYDNDGYVDLYIANSGHDGKVANSFYHNDCGESFTKIMTGNPATDKFTSRTANWEDYDNDDDLDLFVCNESGETDNLYRNMLQETGIADFITVTDVPVVQSQNSSISSSWADYDNDLDPDLFIANFGEGEYNELFRNNGDRTFTKIVEGIQSNEGGNSFGSNWTDYDNDGDLDLFVTNAQGVSPNNFLYRNLLIETDTARFESVLDTVVTNDGGWSYGSSWGDYDEDGDEDLMVAKWHNDANIIHNALFRNEIGNINHWLTIKCVGIITNTSAIGAKVLVKALINDKPVWQMKEISAQQSYCSENLYSHFGLGNATIADSVIINWPSGIRQYLTGTNADQFLTIVEDTFLFSGNKPVCEPYVPPLTEIDNLDITNFLNINPNPASGNITINYRIGTPGMVDIAICNLNGYEVRRIPIKYLLNGTYNLSVETDDLPEGLYFVRLTQDSLTETKKLIILKN